MAESNKDTARGERRTNRPAAIARKGRAEPEWAAGLKRLYDSVVDEPLPDSFKDLLSKLDDGAA